MKHIQQEIDELLNIGRLMDKGPIYLLLYFGQLAITNESGLSYWPKGPKAVVCVVKRDELINGFSKFRKSFIVKKILDLKKEMSHVNENAER